MKFATKLTLLFSGLFLALCAFITHTVTSSSSAAFEKFVTNQMESRALEGMDKIDKVFFERLADMEMMASEPLFKSKNLSPKLVTERLEDLWREGDSYISLSFFDASRKRIADTLGQDIGEIHSPSKYWPGIESGRGSVIGMYYSESLSVPVFHVAVAVKDGAGGHSGVVVGRMTIDWLNEIMKPVLLIQPFDKAMDGEGSMLVDLVDKNGLIIYSNHGQERILKKISNYWEYIKPDVARGVMNKAYRLRLPGAEEEIVTFGREKGYRKFKGNEWTLIIHVPSKAVFAPVTGLRNRLMLSMAAIGGVSILVILLFARTVSRPLKRLSDAVNQIGRGNLDVKVWVDSKDELWALTKNINAMAKSLSSSREALEKAKAGTEEAHKLMEQLFLLLPDLVCIVGRDGYYRKINQAFTHTLGYGERDLLQRPFIEFVHPDDRAATMAVIDNVPHGETATHFENRYRGMDGSYKWISWKAIAPVAGPGAEQMLYAAGRDVTERKHMEEAIRQNAESHREIFENANDFVYTTDLNGIFTAVNRSLCERSGYGSGELVGAPISTLVSPGSLAKARKMTEVKLKGEAPYTRYEMDITAKNGESIPVELSTRLIYKNGEPAGVQGIGRDIGERKRAEERLRQSEVWFRALIENQSDLVMVIDENNRYKYISPSVQRMLGYAPEELGKANFEIIHPADINAVRESTMKAVQNPGMPVQLELRCRHKNGDWITFAATGTSYLENPAIRGIIVNFHDITEIKAAKEEAEAATALKDKFVALVSHDLNGPLSAMLGFLRLLHKDRPPVESKEKSLLGSAINSAENMAALISDILNVSLIKSGKITPRLTFTDAYFLPVRALSALGDQAERKGVTLLNRLPRNTPVYADPELLGQVFQNIISNAIKFCNPGGTVTIFMPDGEPATIAISDTGVGIEPERIGKLFKYDERTSTAGTAGEAGTGLGLPLCHDIVIAHGGSITVESSVGAGSTFSVRLPFMRP